MRHTMKTNWTVTGLVALGSLLFLFPLYLTLVISLKNPEEMAQSMLGLPTRLHFDNFSKAVEMTGFFQALQNSAFITVCAVVLTILSNSMVAYAIARNQSKRFFRFLYYYFISAMFIPFSIIMLPIVKQTAKLGMNNPTGLIFLYVVFGLSFNIFVYVGYLRSIPNELEEAAAIDGCGVWTRFWRIIFPLMTPINATIAILTALWGWNDFMMPLLLLTDPMDATIPLVQYVFKSQYQTDYNLAFASYLMALLPMLLVYIVAQKWIIHGITQGSVKS
jgi:raffinose/stachyose/melibiose transport system permease protein